MSTLIDKSLFTWKGGGREVNAGRYRIQGIKIVGLTAVLTIGSLILSLVGVPRYGTGTIESGEYGWSFLAIFTGFIAPCGGLFALLKTTGGWKETRGDKIYRWQGAAAMAALSLFCCVLISVTVHAAFVVDLIAIHESADGANYGLTPADRKLSTRVGTVFVYGGFVLSLALGSTVLTPGKEPQRDASTLAAQKDDDMNMSV